MEYQYHANTTALVKVGLGPAERLDIASEAIKALSASVRSSGITDAADVISEREAIVRLLFQSVTNPTPSFLPRVFRRDAVSQNGSTPTTAPQDEH
jgi:hypothetical protein